jgi:hypothetical protein
MRPLTKRAGQYRLPQAGGFFIAPGPARLRQAVLTYVALNRKP